MMTESLITIESLPPELLGEIFEECSLANPDAPCLLSRVSKTLHCVVRSTPSAWTKLRLRVSEGDDLEAQRKVELWFSMVGTCMVDVDAHVNQSSTPLSGFFLKNVMPPVFGATKVLRRHTNRIGSLSVEAANECDARSFLGAVFDEGREVEAGVALVGVEASKEKEKNTFALESLVVQVSSTAPPTQFAFSIPVPHLPNLKNLKLVNHSIAFLASRRFDQLADLSITRPIRFVPFSLVALLDILRSAPRLRNLKVGSRILDDAGEDGGLIHLPFLTSLSLRTNVVPSILSFLLLPNLQTLQIDDLNGKRARRSRETATVLRQLLVRMELPSEYRMGTGLKELNLINVDVYARGDSRMGVGGADIEGVWEWCFGRMRALEKLSVAKVDCSSVLDILGSPTWTNGGSGSLIQATSDSDSEGNDRDSKNEDMDFPCPALRRLDLVDTAIPMKLHWFQLRRGEVEVALNRQMESLSTVSPSSSIDYLSLYTDMNSPLTSRSTSPSKPGSNAQSSRTPTVPKFGPWLVLTQQPDV